MLYTLSYFSNQKITGLVDFRNHPQQVIINLTQILKLQKHTFSYFEDNRIYYTLQLISDDCIYQITEEEKDRLLAHPIFTQNHQSFTQS